MKYNEIITLLKEFDYDKNTKENTIYFLIEMLHYLMGEE